MKQRVSAALLAVALAFGTVGVAAAPAEAKAKTFKNCTELNKTYKHGVGKPGAKDKVRGKTKPVTNFKKSSALYKANKKSDRDKDGISCEKR